MSTLKCHTDKRPRQHVYYTVIKIINDLTVNQWSLVAVVTGNTSTILVAIREMISKSAIYSSLYLVLSKFVCVNLAPSLE